jgi:hypothetical protein
VLSAELSAPHGGMTDQADVEAIAFWPQSRSDLQAGRLAIICAVSSS